MYVADIGGVVNTADIQHDMVDSADAWAWPPRARGSDTDLSRLLPSFGTDAPLLGDVYSTFSHTETWPWLYQPWGGVWDDVFGTSAVDVARAALETAGVCDARAYDLCDRIPRWPP
jgi:hypothetical protein